MYSASAQEGIIGHSESCLSVPRGEFIWRMCQELTIVKAFNRNVRIKEDMTNPHSAFYTIFEYMDRTIRILMLIKTFAPERAKRRPILAGRLLKESTLHLRHALAI